MAGLPFKGGNVPAGLVTVEGTADLACGPSKTVCAIAGDANARAIAATRPLNAEKRISEPDNAPPVSH